MNGPQNPPMPALRPVASTHLQAAGHDPKTSTLYIGFKDGSIYSYHGIAAPMYQTLMDHPRPGEYFNARIKGQFKTVKVRSSPPPQKPVQS